MVRLPETLAAWGTPRFADTARAEIEALGAGALPLQQGLARSSVVAGDRCQVVLLRSRAGPRCLYLKVGVFYAGVDAGCACTGDPAPPVENVEYCELEFEIDRRTAAARVRPLPD